VDRLIGRPIVFFSAGRVTSIFFFSLLILDRIESPTAAFIPRLYSDNGIDSTPAVSIAGPSLSSSSGTPPTTSPQILIYALLSMHGVYCAAIDLINRSGACLRQARP
jgi:hypothetical protein